jgi:glycerophosphoryl diester phosphodiesterase
MFYKISLIGFLAFFLGCSKKEPSTIKILGHAGFGLGSTLSVYHSNSAEAVQLAIHTDKCDGFEIDLRISKDSAIWLVHDSDLASNTSGSGCIENSTSSEISHLKYKGFQNEKLCSLNAISDFINSGKTVFLDLKPFNECNQVSSSPKLWDQLLSEQKLKGKQNIYLMVNNYEMLETLSNFGWQVIFSFDDISFIDFAFEKYNKVEGVAIRSTLVGKKQIEEWRKKGKSIYLYGVRTPTEIKRIRKIDPTGVISDDVFGAIIELK